jgi:hypothetical protein
MSEKYQIITVSLKTLSESERYQGGAEEKYKIPWSQIDLTREQMAIFKIDNEPSELSRVWIEKLGAELATVMGLPTATYEMCRTEQDLRAILSPSYMKLEGQERSGMMLMQEVLAGDERLYTVENVLAVFDRLDIGLPSGYKLPPEISTAKDLFVGYLLHDYWIDNPDRHDRNWGIQVDLNGNKELLPNYDYGRALVDFPLTNNRFEIFAERLGEVRTCAFVNNSGNKIRMDEMVQALAKINPDATKYWSNRIAQVGKEGLDTIFNRFPPNSANPARIEFAKVFISYNYLRLQEIVLTIEKKADREQPSH